MLDVESSLARAKLEHVAENRYAAALLRLAGGPGEVVEGGSHRHGVGVVAVIDQRHAVGQANPLTSAGRQRDLHAPARSHADGVGGRDGGQQVVAQVSLGEGKLEHQRASVQLDLHAVALGGQQPHVASDRRT